jgi:NADP-dependent 3-hydroxy acid dehydrogenase YdfG
MNLKSDRQGPLNGRRIMVTGASSGIGEAAVEAIVARGGVVAALARRQDRLDAIVERLGASVLAFECDVTDHDRVRAVAAEAAAAFGGLDGVVANAGATISTSIRDGDPRKWAETFDLLLLGSLVTIQSALAHFPEQGRRDVIAVGSTGALRTMAGQLAYAGAKRGLEASLDAIREELAHYGVAVGLIYPGDVRTEVLEHRQRSGTLPPEVLKPYTVRYADGWEGLPNGGLEASVVGEAIAFMLSLPEGAAINNLVLRPVGQLAP